MLQRCAWVDDNWHLERHKRSLGMLAKLLTGWDDDGQSGKHIGDGVAEGNAVRWSWECLLHLRSYPATIQENTPWQVAFDGM